MPMREVTTAKTILVNDPLLEAMAAAVASTAETVIRIEEKINVLIAQLPQTQGRLEIHIGPVSEQTTKE
jgi:hypothetical protein